MFNSYYNKMEIENAILRATRARISKHQLQIKLRFDNLKRDNRRRITKQAAPPHRNPLTWKIDPGFNPYHVRKKSNNIAFSLADKISNGVYSPFPPFGFTIPKPTYHLAGEPTEKTRVISTFQIADEVVSNMLMRSLTRKNLSRLSSRTYAYLPGRGPLDAISYIDTQFNGENRIYVAEFDFENYFDNLSHDFIINILKKKRILRSETEENLILSFLRSPLPLMEEQPYNLNSANYRNRGLPQGTSISLFLANIAALDLDDKLEKLGVGFVRYADDTLIWSKDYSRICDAVSTLYEQAKISGAPINEAKSRGISILTSDTTRNAEIKFTNRVEFLGHSIGIGNLALSDSSLRRIKQDISSIIYRNLIREPKHKTQDPDRIAAVDRDYVTLIWQLRRYIYGRLSESEVDSFVKCNRIRLPHDFSFSSKISFFPLTQDLEQLKDLDDWLVSQLWSALKCRAKLLESSTIPINDCLPYNIALRKLSILEYRSLSSGDIIDLTIPSFFKINRVVALAVKEHGFSVISKQANRFFYSKQN